MIWLHRITLSENKISAYPDVIEAYVYVYVGVGVGVI